MGRSIGHTVRTVRWPGRGSDYFGPCERCGKPMSETAVFETHTLGVNAEGDIYLSAPSGGVYAHMGCFSHEGEKFVSKESLQRKGPLRIYPRSALVADLERTGINAADADRIVSECLQEPFNAEVSRAGTASAALPGCAEPAGKQKD